MNRLLHKLLNEQNRFLEFGIFGVMVAFTLLCVYAVVSAPITPTNSGALFMFLILVLLYCLHAIKQLPVILKPKKTLRFFGNKVQPVEALPIKEETV